MNQENPMIPVQVGDSLTLQGSPILTGMSSELRVESDPQANGIFLSVDIRTQRLPWNVQALGQVQGLRRFTATHRNEAFWMVHATGSEVREIPGETQWLLMKLTGNRHLMIVPLYNRVARHALRGGKDGTLELVAETADAFTVVESGLCAFIAVTDDPYRLIPLAAKSVLARLGTGRLRTEKSLPSMVDLLGWCTWTAFWGGVRKEDVRSGLSSLKTAGIPIRVLILDDGWQDLTLVESSCSLRLSGFSTVLGKFPDRLTGLKHMIRDDFGLEQLWVWHAIQGYWGGAHVESMKAYGAEDAVLRPQGEIMRKCPATMDWMTPAVGRIPPGEFGRFMNDYHASLKAEGVDGVKIDNQGSLELLADRTGGRVAYYRAARKAIETAVARHFDGNAINCMAHQTETWYQCPTTNLVRTSNDFFPNKPESHGEHLVVNAQVSMWFAEFLHPDWDMFESAHEWGAFHAAARSISGGPIYLCDKPGENDAALVKKMVTSDGRAVRCLDPGRPSPESLYSDCIKHDVLFKVYNRNRLGWVVGVFNLHSKVKGQYSEPIRGCVGPADVPGIEGETFVAYSHASGSCVRVSKETALPLALEAGGFDVVTIAPFHDAMAVIGVVDYLNAGGAVTGYERRDDRLVVKLMDGGRFLAVMDERPRTVLVDGEAVPFEFNEAQGLLTLVQEPNARPRRIEITAHRGRKR